MKNSMIWKTTAREIRGSLGRYLAIFAIVALGVGLFAGLKITKTVFIKSTTEYLRSTDFFDYRILGELGFSEEQVRLFAQQKDVRAAEGAISFDAYYSYDNGGRQVGKFHSIPVNVNKLVLTAGEMPKASNECLADSFYYGKNCLGHKITLLEDDENDGLDSFKEKEFVIVGLVDSPLYLQFERGNSALGMGSVDAFFYLTKETFDVDYYTEVYVKLDKDFTLYVDSYKDYMDAHKDLFEKTVDQASQSRFDELPAMIADAKDTLEEKKAEGQAELNDARAKLEDAKVEIDDARAQIAEGKEKISDGWAELEQAKLDVEEAKKTIEEKEPELQKGKEDIEKGKKTIEENEALIASKETELTAGKTQLETAKMTMQLGQMQYDLTSESLISEQKTIDSSMQSLDERSRAADLLEAFAASLGMEELYAENIAKERESIAKEREKLQKQLEDLNRRYRENLALGEQIKEGKKELEENQKKLEEGEAALKHAKEVVLQAKRDLIEGQRKIAEGEEELRKGKRQIQDGEREIQEGEKTLREKEAEIADAEAKLADGQAEYEKGRLDYLEGCQKFSEQVAKAQKSIDKLEKRYEEGDVPDGYLLGRGTNIGYVCFESDSSIVDGIANVFPVFFFLVAALVCMTTMNRMVEEQRTQIGILKALGYSDGRVSFKFLYYSGSAAIGGAIFGYVVGTHVFPYIIWKVYGIMYRAGEIKFAFDPLLAAVSLAVSILCSMATAWLSCRKELSMNAAGLMRPKAPKSGKRIFLEYITFLWKRLSFLRKVAVRNILRYRKRFFMMVLGIGGCTALLLTGFGLKDSIAGVAEMQYNEIQLHDVSVTLQNEVDEEYLADLELLRDRGLGKYMICQESTLDLVTESGQKSATIFTLPKEMTDAEFSEFVCLKTKKGEKLVKPGKGEAIVTDKIAKMLGITKGSEIVLRDSDQKELRVTVTGIARNYIYNYVFIDESTVVDQKTMHYVPKSLFIKVAEGRDVKELTPKLMKLEGTANVSVTADMVKRFGAMMKSMNLIVILVTACAAGLGFIVLFNLTNINITERIREIATIKVLGFYQYETALYVFRENFVLTILGAFVGLGMGVWLHAFVMSQITLDMVSFGVRIFPISFFYAISLTLLFSVIVSLMMNKRLDDVSMTESLKSVD
ncbi:MAG: FtsX-like permease family protein [Lachnospiraceae bacterium]|nr:FtsX-like permease family protein [Lachnospiraceae bacterium]